MDVSRRSHRGTGIPGRLELYLVIVLLAFAAWVRLETIGEWHANPHLAFHGGEPLLTNYDGYYYLGLARDLLEGSYEPIDRHRGAPDGVARPTPPPLLSVAAAALAGTGALSLDWIGALLPALLGTLLVLPMYALGRYYGGIPAGATAALIAPLGDYYLYRSGVGWFDTDCLNASFTVALAYLLLRFATAEGRPRAGYFCAATATYGFFLWWWDSTPQTVTCIALGTFLVAWASSWAGPRRKGRRAEGVFLAVAASLVVAVGHGHVGAFFNSLSEMYSYLGKDQTGAFPNVAIALAEQGRPALSRVVYGTTSSLAGFAVGVLGLGALVVRRPREATPLLPLLGLGVLPLVLAERFLIFLGPVLALGMGYCVGSIWRWKRPVIGPAAAAVLLVALAWPLLDNARQKTTWPPESPWLAEGLVRAQDLTPPEAILWATPDLGYAVTYWARRATVSDGTLHDGEMTVYSFLPLATDDFRLAANFMHFFGTRGRQGVDQVYRAAGGSARRGLAFLKEVLAGGPQQLAEALGKLGAGADSRSPAEWARFLFPGGGRPVYVLVDWRSLRTAYWWSWFGSWNPALRSGTHATVDLLPGLEFGDESVRGEGGMELNLRTGRLIGGAQPETLRRSILHDRQTFSVREHSAAAPRTLTAYVPGGFAVVADDSFTTSVFSRLYFGWDPPPERFELVDARMPAYRLYRVLGDTPP